MTHFNTSELITHGERRSDKKIPYRVSPFTLIFFMRYIFKNEAYDDQPLCEKINSKADITTLEEITFREFASVISYIDTIKVLQKRTGKMGNMPMTSLVSIPIE